MSGEDGMTEQADGRWRHGETDRGREEDCVSGRGRGKAKRLRRGAEQCQVLERAGKHASKLQALGDAVAGKAEI